jgi:hypothetical protein
LLEESIEEKIQVYPDIEPFFLVFVFEVALANIGLLAFTRMSRESFLGDFGEPKNYFIMSI